MKLSYLAVREVGAGSWGNTSRPSGGVGVADGGSGAARAEGVVWASSGGNIGRPGSGWQVGGNKGDSVAVGVVGAADGVNSSREEELAGGHADEGSENSLESVNIVFGLTLCCVLNDAQPHSGVYLIMTVRMMPNSSAWVSRRLWPLASFMPTPKIPDFIKYTIIHP